MRAILVLAAPLLLLGAGRADAAVDFLDQQITVDLVKDPSQVTIRATVEVAVTAQTETITLAPTSVPVVSLAWNGTPLSWKVDPIFRYLTATLPQPAVAGSKGTLTAELSGMVGCAYSGSYVSCARGADLTYFTTMEGYWYLHNTESQDPFTGAVKLLLPAGHRAATLGAAPVVEPGAGGSTWTFSFKRQAAEIMLVAGALEEVRSTVAGGFPVRGLCANKPAYKTALQVTVDQASQLIPFFGKLWGAPPIEELQYGVIRGTTPWAGISMEGLILLNDVIYSSALSYILPEVNHELGHLWWGTMASAASPYVPESGFLNESLAEYSLWRGRGALEGDDTRDSGTRMNAVWYMYRRPAGADARVLDAANNEVYVFSVYHKGSTAVRTLEELVGVDALDAGLRALVKAGQGKGSLTELMKGVQSASGVDPTEYVNKWLKGLGYPVVKVTSTLTASAGGFQLTLAASGDDFPMRLPVKLRHADGKVERQTLSFQGGSGKAQLDLAARPAVIEIDPGWTAVREVHPAVEGDVSMDGRVDGADLIEVALRVGGFLPDQRRLDGKYDPLHDLDGDRKIGDGDLDVVVARAAN